MDVMVDHSTTTSILSLLEVYLSSNYPYETEDLVKVKKTFEDVFSPVESWLIWLQSLLLWKQPVQTIALIASFNVLIWIMSYSVSHIIAYISWSCLSLYFLYTWKTVIWPTIKVPSKIKDDQEWVPIQYGVLSIPELSQLCAESFLLLRFFCKALVDLRKRRKSAYVMLLWIISTLIMAVGHAMSGLTFIYLCGMTALLLPGLLYHEVLSGVANILKVYIPLLTSFTAKQSSKTVHEHRYDASFTPVIDTHGLDSAPFTESEDDDHTNVDQPITSNQAVESFIPDVSLMPDFDQICDDSHSLMLDNEVMPSIDELDSSCARYPVQRHSNVAIEAGSLLHSALTNEQSEYPTSLTGNTMVNLASSVINTLKNAQLMNISSSQADEHLRFDPRDRIGDASHVHHDGDSDFELISEDDIAEYL